MNLTEQQVSGFRRDGFLNLGRPVLSDDEVLELREALDRVLNGTSPRKPAGLGDLSAISNMPVIQAVNMWEADDAYYRHLYNPTITGMIAQLMGTDTVRVWHDQMQLKPARIGGPTTWHQDHPYWPIIQPADLISAWVAIEDATIENGAMSMVRGSYKWGPYKGGTVGTNLETHEPERPEPGLMPEGAAFEIVPCEVKAGSVVFHHCLTWHGARPNTTERRRPAIAVHYMPGYTRYEPGSGEHMIGAHVEVAPGEILKGRFFPTVYDNGHPLRFEDRELVLTTA